MSAPRATLRVATRASALARWQAERVATLLDEAHGGTLRCELVLVQTEGDRRRDVPIDRIGGRGVFVKEVQAAVLDGRADLAVHSAKDLPSAPDLQPAGLVLACIPERADARDALVGAPLGRLPAGARVATGSARRRAQLAHLRPDLTFADLRGNIGTRLDRAADHGAVVVAVAALQRMQRLDEIAEVLPPSVMLPQVAQGALAVECREGDGAVLDLLAAIDDPAASRAVLAERSYLARLGGGCDLPVAAYAVDEGGTLELTGLVASHDGRIVVRDTMSGDDPEALGSALADRVLEERGGGMLLA